MHVQRQPIRRDRGKLWWSRRSVDPSPSVKPDIERRLDDRAQWAPRVRAQCRNSSVSDIAFPPRSMPSMVLVSRCLAHGYEISPSFHAIAVVDRFSKLMRRRIWRTASHTGISCIPLGSLRCWWFCELPGLLDMLYCASRTVWIVSQLCVLISIWSSYHSFEAVLGLSLHFKTPPPYHLVIRFFTSAIQYAFNGRGEYMMIVSCYQNTYLTHRHV